MHSVFAAARFFPWWALPSGFVLVEMGVYFRRRKSNVQFHFFAVASALIILSLCWFVFRGDLHSDAWVRTVTGG